eukprot:3063832-Rhodomonas_salina.1
MSETPPTERKLLDTSPLKLAVPRMPDVPDTPPLFPDFAKDCDVHRQYTVADLKVILSDVWLSLAGDKKALVARVCEHAAIQVALLDAAAIVDLTDLQVISALQLLKIPIPWDIEERLETLLAAVTPDEETPLPPPTPPARATPRTQQPDTHSQVADSMAAMLELMQSEMALKAKSVAELTATEPTTPPDVKEVNPPPETTDVERPPLAARSEGVTSIADAFVRALEELLGSSCHGSSEEPVADNAALLQITCTHPALVQLHNHNNNQHTLGMLVRRAITFDFAPEQGIAAVTWRMTQEAKETEIHAKIHTGVAEAAYAEGEAEFYEHVTHVLNLASKYSTDAARYQQQRNNQR